MSSIELFRLVQRFRKLTPAQQAAVRRFVDELSQGSWGGHIVPAAGDISEPAFAAVWDNDEDAEYDRL